MIGDLKNCPLVAKKTPMEESDSGDSLGIIQSRRQALVITETDLKIIDGKFAQPNGDEVRLIL